MFRVLLLLAHLDQEPQDPAHAARPAVEIGLRTTGELSRVLSGGRRRETAARALFLAEASLDLDAAWGWTGARARVAVHALRGDDGNAAVGDLQVFSNLDNPEGFDRLEEVWLEQELAGGVLRAKVGQVDANTEFAFLDSASGFLHSSAGYSPTILGFPSYPTPRPALNLFIEPDDAWRLGAGLYEAVAGERFWIAQADFRWSDGSTGLGGWRLEAELPRFDGGTVDASEGAYLVLEQTLWDGSGRNLKGFLQGGVADQDLAVIHLHLGAGLVLRGPFPLRSEDELGLGFSRAGLSRVPGARLEDRAEDAVEIFYRARLGEAWVLQPDLQWIRNPGGRGLENAWILSLRTELAF